MTPFPASWRSWKIDLILGEIKAEHDTIPGQLEELNKSGGELKDAIEEQEAELKNIKIAIRDAESKISLLNETVKKYKQQLMIVKTNREYSALLTEIEGVKKEKEELDDGAIKNMERIEVITTEIEESKKKLEDFQTQSKDKLEELSGRIKDLSKKMAVQERKRGNLAIRIEKGTLKLYERIMNSRNDRAVVPLRNGSCGGCFAEVPLQKVADIRKGDQLLTCDNCGRILYYEER